MKSVFVFMAYLAVTNAVSDSELENQEEGRLFYNINGLNATMLVIGVAILIGLLYYAVFAAKSPDVRADDPYGYGYDPYQGTQYEGYQYQNRYRRFANNGNVVFIIFLGIFFEHRIRKNWGDLFFLALKLNIGIKDS